MLAIAGCELVSYEPQYRMLEEGAQLLAAVNAKGGGRQWVVVECRVHKPLPMTYTRSIRTLRTMS